MEPLLTQYNPKETEKIIYKRWLEGDYFNPDKFKTSTKESFSVVLPPPNVTGTLHLGHALNATIQDVLVRYHRMNGSKTVWIPGTDHASIALQSTLEKKLRKEGISRFDLGREKFLEKVWEWREKYGTIILDQLKSLGVSCDWSRTKFTMDDDYVAAVEQVFLHYFDKGWVYRGERVVNWCPRCGTSISDLEVDMVEEPSKLWYLKYPIANFEDKFIIVATTRPETMLGDTAVAVNPKDGRYQSLIGKLVMLPLAGRQIPIVADEAIDIEFGTGAVKVTPAHDLTDWEIGQRHDLPVIAVINERGKMNDSVPQEFRGLKIMEARQLVVAKLKEMGLLEKIDDYTHQIPKCARCSAGIELLPSKQWFIKMDELAKLASGAVKTGQVKFHPQRWEGLYFSWWEKPRDWCISRQLWWGQRLPVWFCANDPEKFIASIEEPKECPVCKKCRMQRSEDVFDTWFSSALWPLATLGWPNKTKDFQEFYPTNILSTARDIINLWVARMIFSGLELTGKVPFSDVIIHATVLTKDGKRMSKSLGTGIDPLLLVDKYGADATRFGLSWQQIIDSQDIHFAEDAMISGRKFCNKIWNAARFVLTQIGDVKDYEIESAPAPVTEADMAILQKLNLVIGQTNEFIASYELGHAIRGLYEFFWHDFCDTYIETAKTQIADPKTHQSTKQILIYVLANSLKLLHPFMPFVTTQIYFSLPVKDSGELMLSAWPKQ